MIEDTGYKIDQLLADSRFTLTGSRHFHNISPNLVPIVGDTDWDFVAEYSEELVIEALAKGFTAKNPEWADGRIINTQPYVDPTTVVVLYDDANNIQLILKRKVYNYIELQELITPEFYVRYLWKRNTPVSIIQDFYQLMLTEII